MGVNGRPGTILAAQWHHMRGCYPSPCCGAFPFPRLGGDVWFHRPMTLYGWWFLTTLTPPLYHDIHMEARKVRGDAGLALAYRLIALSPVDWAARHVLSNA